MEFRTKAQNTEKQQNKVYILIGVSIYFRAVQPKNPSDETVNRFSIAVCKVFFFLAKKKINAHAQSTADERENLIKKTQTNIQM